MNTLSYPGAALRLRGAFAIALVALAVALLGASSARAAGAVGLVDTSGLPIFYQDATGLQLAPCLLGPPSCFGTLPDLQAANGEAFYTLATANLTDPASGGTFTITTAVEAANFGIFDTFARIRVVGKGLPANTTYTVSEPYGDVTVTSSAIGIAKDTSDIGCLAGTVICDPTLALASPVFGGFLQWNTLESAPPLGFIGDNVTPHTVVGSPLARNFVQITSPSLATPLFTDRFVVQGQLAAGATPPGMLPPAAPPAPHLLPADDTGVNATDNITNVAAPSIVGSTMPNANVTVTADGAANGAGTALADGSFSIKLPTALGNGLHVLTVKAANPLSGAASPASPSLSITVDTVKPAVPSAPQTAQPSAASFGATFTGSADADSTVTLFADGVSVGSGPATGGAYSIRAAALGSGLHHITAAATDVAGNASLQSAALSLSVGSLAAIPQPTLATDSGNSSDGITNVSRPTFSGSVPVNSATVDLFANGNAIGSGSSAAGAYSIPASSALADGKYLVTVVVTDNANGLQGTSTALPITIDTAAPHAPSMSAGSATAASGTAEAGSTVTVYVDNSVAVSTTASAGGAWSASFGALAPGAHAVAATATDAAGNTSGHSAALTVAVAAGGGGGGGGGGGAAPVQPSQAPAAGGAQAPAAGKEAAPRVTSGPAVVAVGVLTVARSGNHASVSAVVNVDAGSRLAVSAAAPGGGALTLLRGSRLGSTVQRAAHATSLGSSLRSPGRVRIELNLDRSQLSHAGLYRVVVRATDAGGHTSTLRIAFRVK